MVLIQHPLLLLASIVCLGVALAAAAYAITPTGGRRLIAVVVAALALVAQLWLVVGYGEPLLLVGQLNHPSCCWPLLGRRRAMDWDSGRSGVALPGGPSWAGGPAGAADEPQVGWRQGRTVQPRGGGEAAGHRADVLEPGDDWAARRARVASGADVIGMAGGDGSQAWSPV